jgi:catecholate siderophore receptor
MHVMSARYTSTFRLPSLGDYVTNVNATPVIRTMDFIEAG